MFQFILAFLLGISMSTADQNRGSVTYGAKILNTKSDTIPVLPHAPNQDWKNGCGIERIRLCKLAAVCKHNVLKKLKVASGRMPFDLMSKPVHNVPIVVNQVFISGNPVF